MKKNKYKIKDMFLDAYKETKRSSLLVFLILRTLVIVCMVLQILNGELENAFLCLLSLALLLLPSIIQHRLDITLPNTLEIIIYLFIFSSEILGEINNFYAIIPSWDTILHTLNGFLCAAVGFSLVDILNREEHKYISMTPGFVALVSFCFSMTIGILWEFFEFGADYYLKTDMQKDRFITEINSKEIGNKEGNEKIKIDNINKTVIYYDNDKIFTIENAYLDIGIIDTMKDLFVNFLGAVIFSILGYLYIKDRDEYKFIERFIPITKKLQE